jgi:cell division septation protein DedD
MHKSFLTRLNRALLALLVFSGIIATVLYLGFGVKFQQPKITKKTTKTAPPVRAQPSRFTLELGVTRSQPEAENIVDQLAEVGIQAYYTPVNINGKSVYRIRRGIYPSAELARRDAEELIQQKKLAVKVIRLN